MRSGPKDHLCEMLRLGAIDHYGVTENASGFPIGKNHHGGF